MDKSKVDSVLSRRARRLARVRNYRSANKSGTVVMTGSSMEDDESFHFVKNHWNEAFRSMDTMRQNTVLCDVILAVDDVKIPAHKVVLAATSPYFHAMFTNEMLEKSKSEVEMHDIDAQAMCQLVDYAYTSQIVISENNVQVLLPAACILQMMGVRDACCNFLRRQLYPSNCLGIRRFSDVHDCEELRLAAHQFALQHFLDVGETEEFLLLPPRDLKDLVSSDDLNVETEEQVFEAVVKWIRFDLSARRKYIAEVMSGVRLPLLSRDFLMNNVEHEEILTSDTFCKDLLIEALRFHLMPEKRALMTSERTKERQTRDVRPVIMAVGTSWTAVPGGSSLFAVHTECEYYNISSDTWLPGTPMTMRRSRCAVTVAGCKLYSIGGYDGSQDLCTAEFYNPKSNKWTKIADMGTRRSGLAACEWHGLVYAVGGYDGASCLSSVERYDPLTQTWSSVASMIIRRRYLKLAVMEDTIYAIGGYDGACHMSSVEKFDPTTGSWSTGTNMMSRRSNAGVAVLDGMLYVCGGTDGASCLSSVERFNPRRNMWEAVAPMHMRRSTHDVVAFDGSLYAIGGNDGSTSLSSVEVYNPKLNKWNIVASMNLRRSNVGAAVVDMVLTAPEWALAQEPEQ